MPFLFNQQQIDCLAGEIPPPLSLTGETGSRSLQHPARGVHWVCAARAGASRAGTDPGLSHAGLAARAFLRHGSFVPGKQPIVATEAKMPIKAILGATSASLANQDQHQELQGQRRETPTSPLTSVRVTSGYFKALQELRLSPEAAAIKTFPHCLKNSALPECGRKFFSLCSSALGHSGMLKQLCSTTEIVQGAMLIPQQNRDQTCFSIFTLILRLFI